MNTPTPNPQNNNPNPLIDIIRDAILEKFAPIDKAEEIERQLQSRSLGIICSYIFKPKFPNCPAFKHFFSLVTEDKQNKTTKICSIFAVFGADGRATLHCAHYQISQPESFGKVNLDTIFFMHELAEDNVG